MSVTINIYYSGENGNARKFAEEMIASGTVADIRREDGNEQYDYFFPIENPDTVLLIDKWKSREALAAHHALPLMNTIARLREKYDLHMRVERYLTDDTAAPEDEKFIRK